MNARGGRTQFEELHRRRKVDRSARAEGGLLPDTVRPQRSARQGTRTRNRSAHHLSRQHRPLRRRRRGDRCAADPRDLADSPASSRTDGSSRRLTPYVDAVKAMAATRTSGDRSSRTQHRARRDDGRGGVGAAQPANDDRRGRSHASQLGRQPHRRAARCRGACAGSCPRLAPHLRTEPLAGAVAAQRNANAIVAADGSAAYTTVQAGDQRRTAEHLGRPSVDRSSSRQGPIARSSTSSARSDS